MNQDEDSRYGAGSSLQVSETSGMYVWQTIFKNIFKNLVLCKTSFIAIFINKAQILFPF